MPSTYQAQRSNLNAAIVVKIFSYAHQMHYQPLQLQWHNYRLFKCYKYRVAQHQNIYVSEELFSALALAMRKYLSARSECCAFTFGDDFC